VHTVPKRQDILDAALALADAEGPHALSVRAVAHAAGVGPSTLRHYFPTQAELHEAVAREKMRTVLDDRDIANAERDPAERLLECLEQFLPFGEHLDAHLGAWLHAYTTALGPSAGEASRRLLVHGHRLGATAVRRWLTVLAAEGHVASSDIDAQVTTLLAVVDGLALHLLADPERVDAAGARQSLRWTVDQVIRPLP
jgi:AcrR family transcriptional regulator